MKRAVTPRERERTPRERERDAVATLDFILGDSELRETWKSVKEWRRRFAGVIGDVRADAKEAEAAGQMERAEALKAIATGRV